MISRRDKPSATQTVNSGSVCSHVKLNALKTGVHSLEKCSQPAWRSALEGSVKPPPCVADMWQLGSKVPPMSPAQGNVTDY